MNKPSRTSTRVRPNVNYTNLAQGTGEASVNLDYSEVSAGKGKKPLSLKINTEVFKKCLDFFKKIRESSEL